MLNMQCSLPQFGWMAGLAFGPCEVIHQCVWKARWRESGRFSMVTHWDWFKLKTDGFDRLTGNWRFFSPYPTIRLQVNYCDKSTNESSQFRWNNSIAHTLFNWGCEILPNGRVMHFLPTTTENFWFSGCDGSRMLAVHVKVIQPQP